MGDKMTCQDCIHCTNNKCEVWEIPNPRIMCDYFDYNDGSYHDGHWHCHRCGKIVEVAGLCYDCEKWLSDNPIDDSWESVSK